MSKIEQVINEIEDYVESCKPQAFSNTKIVVNKEEIEELLAELRARLPEEIKQYQKIISNQDNILNQAKDEAERTVNEAKSKADDVIAKATDQANQMVSEHEIMRKAYDQANQLLADAQGQAQQIVDNAVKDANNVRQSSIKYADDMLASLQTIIGNTMDNARDRFDAFSNSLESSMQIVNSNRNELAGSIVTDQTAGAEPAADGANGQAQ
ncbi:vacuolar family H+-ATPase subunit H [Clostridium vitabionis]|jgi:vacuolar-type H+-ATPase subunit H|uniref:vacuolar family H+-ATPase subunit H n=1 Tax=Clostridium vitabionis TaxID=2784388 RepID=UPI00188C3BA5|nr:vacuolar family H+-ATPase subunit H [Clostridium vitabionis]